MPRTIKRGEIYWVNFEPAKGSEQGRVRPALVIQNDIGNLYSPITIVVPITSKVGKKQYPQTIYLPAGTGGLLKDSEILANQIRAITKERIQERIGSLSHEEMRRVEQAILLALGMYDYHL
ncbi:MAG: type II toxin-antitoxin system PemK/MazF family toxin [Nitrospirae bacterium]|nr:type II toxin-antitoxin system PemK/MazF family toxin [Nitrospirota bacterium]